VLCLPKVAARLDSAVSCQAGDPVALAAQKDIADRMKHWAASLRASGMPVKFKKWMASCG
jgi:hypothetical protein